MLERILNDIWYGRSPLALVLSPLAWLFQVVVALRRSAYRTGLFTVTHAGVPVIVVGGITVGGTGKTPLVIWLARHLRARGMRPGVVARGYGGHAAKWPQQVRGDSDPATVGDEAIVIARHAGCPVAVAPDRSAAAAALVRHAGCDVIISDDGLQHYALARNLEIAVIDGVRRFGNGRCLPAGPLREPQSRLKSVDMIVTRGVAARGEFPMTHRAPMACKLSDVFTTRPVDAFRNEPVHAVAGLGHAEQFFTMLRARGLHVTAHPFPDHHRFRREELQFADRQAVLMTEKDAVKCERFAAENWWYIPIEAELPEVFARRLDQLMEKKSHGQAIA